MLKAMHRNVFAPRDYQPDPKCRFFDSAAESGMRLVGHADDIVRLRHNGWFTNEFQDGILRGIVLQVPGRNGQARFVAGYEESESGGICVDLTELYFGGTDEESDKRDAAYAADSMAERWAEKERDWNEAWQAGSAWQSDLDEATELRRSIKSTVAAYRTIYDGCDATTDRLYRDRIRCDLKHLAKLRDRRHESLDEVGSWARDAFLEGTGFATWTELESARDF